MIQDTKEAVFRVIRMIKEGKETACTGRDIPIKAESNLVRGDGPHAVEFVLALREGFEKNGITVKNFMAK